MAQEPVLSEAKPAAGVPTVLYVTQQGQTAQGTVFCMNQNPMKYGDAISVALRIIRACRDLGIEVVRDLLAPGQLERAAGRALRSGLIIQIDIVIAQRSWRR